MVKPSLIKITSPSWKPSFILVLASLLPKGFLAIARCNLSLISFNPDVPERSVTIEPCTSKL